MKNNLLSLLFVALVSAVSAQTFATLPFATMDSTHDCNEWVEDYVYIQNTTGSSLSLNFVTLTDSMTPMGWDALLCTSVTCSPVIPPNGTLGTILPGDSAFLHLSCGLLGIPGTASCRFRVYEVGNPTNDDTITFTYHSLNYAGIADGSDDEFTLSQNYPNPFSGSTLIMYDLANSNGELVVTDIHGKTIGTQMLTAGSNSVFLIVDYSPGIYFYSLYRNDVLLGRKKMIVQ